jgi:short-subunit dehydrogenase
MKTAIIVGASSGIGRELAKILSTKGFHLGLAARRVDLLVGLEKKLPNPSRAVQMDVAKVAVTRQSMQSLIANLGTVDLVVISAATGHLNPELSFSKEAETIATNVCGFTAVANVAFKHFLHKKSVHRKDSIYENSNY